MAAHGRVRQRVTRRRLGGEVLARIPSDLIIGLSEEKFLDMFAEAVSKKQIRSAIYPMHVRSL